MAGYAAIGLVALAAGLILQPGRCNETAHLALVKSLVVRFAADRLVPGYGTAAAVLLGGGTLVLQSKWPCSSPVASAIVGGTVLRLEPRA